MAQGPYTWGMVKQYVQFRMNRPDLPLDFIDTEGREIAEFYSSDVFPSGYVTDDSITLQQGQQFYPVPSAIRKVTFLRFLMGSVWIPISLVDHYEDLLLSDVLQPPITSVPAIARVYGKQIRIFPTPNTPFPLEITGEAETEPPADDNDTTYNFWCAEGRILMINATAAKIAAEYIRDDAAAGRYSTLADRAYQKLQIYTHASQGPMIIRQHL